MIKEFRNEYRFLSNFHPCLIDFEGKIYNSVEHAYQAAKTRDENTRDLIRASATSGTAKRLGQRLTLRKDWEDIKIDIMRDLVRKKFNLVTLKSALLLTGNEELVEGNWWGDRFWGQSPLGQGKNWLGKILMEIREELKDA